MDLEMIIVCFNSSIEEEIAEALTDAGMESYTKIPCVQGAGRYSEPRLDSHVWPGTNTVYLIVVETDLRKKLMEALGRMKEIHRKEGVSAFVLPVASIL
jgi:nitrogen regulatory protein PII